MRGLKALISGVLSVRSRLAQQPAAKGGRVDVQKYTIDADINPRTQSITATAKLDFVALDNVTEIVLELNNALNIDKVTDGQGNPLHGGRNAQDFYRPRLASSTASERCSTAQLVVTYTGKLTGDEDSPVYGIRFAALHPDYGYLLYPARWFPVSGYTTDRFTADIHVTVPAEYSVIASGDAKTHRSGDHNVQSFHYDNASFPEASLS